MAAHYATSFGTVHRGRFSSFGRALDCRAGGRGFNSQGRTNTQGLKITEKWVDFELRLKCLIRRAQHLLLLRGEIDHILVNY